MKKAVLARIDPKWHDAIASGEKLVDVHYTMPKLDFPFKVYLCEASKPNTDDGKVIGEYLCRGIDKFTILGTGVKFRRFRALYQSRMSLAEMVSFANGRESVYGWKLSDLKLYSESEPMTKFFEPCNEECETTCRYLCYDPHDEIPGAGEWYCGKGDIDSDLKVPEDWCYIEDNG